MSKAILKELPVLVEEGIINPEVASRIQEYYQSKGNSNSNRLVIVFGVLGALLVGLGIILIIAHNWDTLSKGVKLVFALVPMLIGQILALRIVFKNTVSIALREATATFLILSVAAAISLVSQIYNIHGDLSNFLLIWMALSIPVIYVLKSSLASILVWIGATWYASVYGYFNGNGHPAYYYLALAAFALPHFIILLREKSTSNFTLFHNWIISLSLLVSFGAVAAGSGQWVVPGYISLFGLFIIIGQLTPISSSRLGFNAYLIVGSLGTIIILLFSSFQEKGYFDTSLHESLLPFFTTGISIVILIYCLRGRRISDVNPITFAFILFFVIFIVGNESSEVARLLANLTVLTLSLLTIREGSRKNHLGLLNYGLLILSALIICRFFDSKISFVLRGMIFILVGAGFFTMNYLMIRKKSKTK